MGRRDSPALSENAVPPPDGVWTRELLVTAEKANLELDFLFFWGHTPSGDQSLGPWVFSNWFPSPFQVDGTEYRTAEHFMMAAKARRFDDAASLAKILAAETPAEAKRYGRGVSNFSTELWEQDRLDVVISGSVAKFGSDPRLKDYLLETGERILCEASPVDQVWGIGLAADHPDAAVPTRWTGRNLLGQALMAARAQLR